MKKILVIFCVSVFFVFSCSGRNGDIDIQNFKTRFTVKNHPVKVGQSAYDGVFNLYFVQTVTNLKWFNSKDWMIAFASGIKEMAVLRSVPMPKGSYEKLLNDVLSFCEENQYKSYVNTSDTGSPATLFTKSSGGQITGLIIISMDDFTEGVESVEVRCIHGVFSAEDVAKIASLHGDGHREIAKGRTVNIS